MDDQMTVRNRGRRLIKLWPTSRNDPSTHSDITRSDLPYFPSSDKRGLLM